jgi:monoamine oxidase
MDAEQDTRACDVVIIGAGLSGLYAARALVAAGVDVLVLEAQNRVGGRTRTTHLADGTCIDEGGQWVSPGQDHIVQLAAALGVALFPGWREGLTVDWHNGQRSTYHGLFPPGDPAVAPAARNAAARLTQMAGTVPLETPWTAPQATAWDQQTLHSWLAANVGPARARNAIARAIEGVVASGPGGTSLLAALFCIRSGDALGPFVAAHDPGPAQRVASGAQQLASRMAAALGDRVRLDAWASHITHHAAGVRVTAGALEVRARRAIIAMAPAMAGRVRYTPALPVARDQLTQRTPMGWVITVHCVYPTRFWRDDGLSAQVTSDAGGVRVTADTSPPSGSPGVLVGFIAGAAARRLAPVTRAERRGAVLADLVRYFGPCGAAPGVPGVLVGG